MAKLKLETGYRKYMTEREYFALHAAVSAIPRELHGVDVVEIGSGVGSSTAIIAEALDEAGNPARLRSIDPLAYPAGVIRKMTKDRYRSQEKAILRSMKPHRERYELIQRRSVELLAEWDAPIALLHIDGDHREEAVSIDLEYADFVQVGGYLVMHDVGSHPGTRMGPTRAFIRWWTRNAAGWTQVVRVDRLLVLQRVDTAVRRAK